MQANLQATTFNKHNQIKNDRINRIENPHMNKISLDLSYKKRAINSVARNPVHINGGVEYLYNQRLRILQLQLKQHEITLETYNQRVADLQVSCYGRIITTNDYIIPKSNLPSIHQQSNESIIDPTKAKETEENNENTKETIELKEDKEETNEKATNSTEELPKETSEKELINMINSSTDDQK